MRQLAGGGLPQHLAEALDNQAIKGCTFGKPMRAGSFGKPEIKNCLGIHSGFHYYVQTALL